MRPARPLDLSLDTLRAKNADKSSRKKKRPGDPPGDAHAQADDQSAAMGQHGSQRYLSGRQRDPPPLPQRTGPDGSAKGVSTEVEKVEHILEDSDQTPPGDEKTPPYDNDAELDLAAEKASALDLLSAMFNEANTDWCGAEGIDLNVEIAGVDTDGPHSVPASLELTNFEVVPASHEPRASQREENKSRVDRQADPTPTPATSGLAQPSTNNKLKDLFAPREEEGFSLIGHLDLDSELDLDMDMNLHAAAPAPALDSSLPFIFAQKGHVQMISFAWTEDEAEIRACWEVARGELTREWKRRHREAVKSRRRGGAERFE
ncbi:hypothetical protein EI94DRAFT_1811743 [Lactarius quietus]|nr:hypothetical protein EI94DRAFT_1811743 [Lactarius quietus]